MSKRMFVVLEVKNDPNHPDWVIPVEPLDDGHFLEGVRKSRVIYADEMEVTDYENQPIKDIRFIGVSPTPETDPWEEWVDSMPLVLYGDHYKEFKDWLRKMPKERIHGTT